MTRAARAKAALIAVLAVVLPSGFSSAQTPPTASDVAGYTGLLAAVARGDAVEVKRLAGGADLNMADSHGRTALHIAAHRGDRDIARILASAGADLRALDSRRYDILTIAAVRDDIAFLELSIELGADPGAITSPYEGTALIAAAHLGHDGIVRSLIRAGAPLDRVNNLGWTALIEAIVLGDGGPRHLACVAALLDAGANPNLGDRAGRTPLALARERGYAAMAELIARAGGN
jgi:ankyrin repeat protein